MKHTGNNNRRPLFAVHFAMAWRNIWRNRRRAVITMASIFFATFFCAVTTCQIEGMWEKMIENTLRTQTGHIQIHGKGYWEDKIADNFMTMDEETLSRLAHIYNVANVSPRAETFAMASFGTVCRGIAVTGVSPGAEAEKSNLPARLTEGAYLAETDDGILIGRGLSEYLKVSVGDTLALIGQGYHGASAAGLFPVRGILDLVIAELDNGVGYISLTAAQQFIDMPGGYSGILVALHDNGRLEETLGAVRQTVDTLTLDVYSWHFTMERLLQTSVSDKAFSEVLMYILYLIVGFGILGTVIMMTNERRRELVMIISLGMTRRQLALVMAAEILMMALLGVALALAVAVPLVHFFAAHPVEITGQMGKMYTDMGMEPLLPMSTKAVYFLRQVAVIALLTALATVYPVRKILRLNTNERN